MGSAAQRYGGVLLLLWGFMGCASSSRTELNVYAAASLTDALTVFADSFAGAYPDVTVTLNVASSSSLARQIALGAPADVFFSAHPDWIVYLQDRQKIQRADTLLTNQLVVIGSGPSANWSGLESLPHFAPIALADPTHVPAGQYAKVGLTCLGLWDTLEDQVIPMLDVRAALISVARGVVDVGVVYRSDVQRAEVTVWAEWPPACQPDIQYLAASVTASKHPHLAQTFLDFVQAPSQKLTWERFGFTPFTSTVTMP